jgi:hypothetical protein
MHGYVESIEHPEHPGINLKVPMSWKSKPTRFKNAMNFTHCYGHGVLSFSMRVESYPLLAGLIASPQDIFDAMTEEAAAEEFGGLGMTLKTFSKTKLNGMPAAVMTLTQPMEQLGAKFVFEISMIQVLSKENIILLMLYSPGPENSDAGLKRLKKNDPLFKLVASSLTIAKKD